MSSLWKETLMTQTKKRSSMFWRTISEGRVQGEKVWFKATSEKISGRNHIYEILVVSESNRSHYRDISVISFTNSWHIPHIPRESNGIWPIIPWVETNSNLDLDMLIFSNILTCILLGSWWLTNVIMSWTSTSSCITTLNMIFSVRYTKYERIP